MPGLFTRSGVDHSVPLLPVNVPMKPLRVFGLNGPVKASVRLSLLPVKIPAEIVCAGVPLSIQFQITPAKLSFGAMLTEIIPLASDGCVSQDG